MVARRAQWGGGPGDSGLCMSAHAPPYPLRFPLTSVCLTLFPQVDGAELIGAPEPKEVLSMASRSVLGQLDKVRKPLAFNHAWQLRDRAWVCVAFHCGIPSQQQAFQG